MSGYNQEVAISRSAAVLMDKEQEIQNLRDQLESINSNINGELGRIENVKTNLSTAYRRVDKEKYEAERAEIMANLKKYGDEQASLRTRLAELEVSP